MAKKQNKFKDLQESVPGFLKNKYILSAIVFLFLIVFAGTNCLIAQLKMGKEISKLRQQRDFYDKEIVELKTYLHELQNNEIVQEKVARERYFVKKPNEEVFIMKEIE